jgi:hypothetical protein
MTPKTRKNIYTIVSVTIPILVSLGYLTGELSAQILNAVSAILAIGATTLARNNVK